MSQPIGNSQFDFFNDNPRERYPQSQQINNNINQMLDNIDEQNIINNNSVNKVNNDNSDFIYELVFNTVSNISNSEKSGEIKIKIIRILIKLIENIVEAETKKEDSEKFRRIKISNPNISLLFDIKGNYEFLKLLGFEEEFFGEDLTLYLPKNNINIPLFQQLLSYTELLLLNFNENKDTEQNYYERSENDFIGNYKNYQDIDMDNFEDNKKESYNEQNNKDILQILKETKDVRLGKNNINMEHGDNWNVRPPGPSREGAKILRETGKERYKNALLHSKSLNTNGNNWNKGNNNFNSKIHTFDDFNQSSSENKPFFGEEIKRSMTLDDLEFKNPTNLKICKDEIGKKCLELTNIFRAKNKLPPLKWDDSIWAIAYTHSKNMGDKKVPFGHKGFNERIRKFPFYFSTACENVFMCQGYSQYDIAQFGVDGWINSPGHRKNLLSRTTHCAIATYRTSSGAFYLTQMFARK